jgi:hypothetical protein
MRARGVVPDEVSMNNFVRIFKEEGRHDDTLALFYNWTVYFLDLDCITADSDGPMQFLLADICVDKFAAAGGAPPAIEGQERPRKPKLVVTYNRLISMGL